MLASVSGVRWTAADEQGLIQGVIMSFAGPLNLFKPVITAYLSEGRHSKAIGGSHHAVH